MNEHSSDRDPIEELAAEFTERCRRGEQPSIEEYASKHPSMADDIRELFPMIVQVEAAKQSDTSWSGPRPAGFAPAPERLGDFRIIRELGRGGMGIVYEAEQESLGRRVAIKVLPDRHLSSPTRRERFEREARTAAALHHTNIVQIFGVGQQDGHPYFVMQYIRGVGLDAIFARLASRTMVPRSDRIRRSRLGIGSLDLVQVARELLNSRGSPIRQTGSATPSTRESPAASAGVLAGLPEHAPDAAGGPVENHPAAASPAGQIEEYSDELAYWRSLARLFAQAADALSFAHSQGVLHRDIKPANLLLDAEGMLWVTDFGLAKTDEYRELTQTGDVIGTLCYMAPEQFEGKGDQRSDIYSLGITLYEMATLRPAFVQEGRSGLIRAILREPLFPPRRLCPSMPCDLETVILKAAARDPQHRYASAAELRDDLLRFVEDRPVQARRVSAAEKLWRWSRRNPALATTTALTLALLISIAAVSSVAYLKVRAANAVERQQRQRAEETANLAVTALDTIFDEFAPAGRSASREVTLGSSDEGALVVSVPSVLSPETAAFLKGLLRFYSGLASQESNSPSLLLKMAAAQRRVGEIYELLGQYEDAKAAYADSISQYEALRKATPGDLHIEVALARVNNQLGQVYAAQDEMPEAHARFDAARRLLQSKIEAGSDSDEASFELARACYLLSRRVGANTPVFEQPPPGGPPGSPPRVPGGLGPGEGRPPGPAPPEARLPDGERDPPPPAPPPPGEPGEGRQRLGVFGQDRDYLRQAVEILTRLSDEKPGVPEYRHLLALCLCQPSGPPREGMDKSLRGLGAAGSSPAPAMADRLPVVPGGPPSGILEKGEADSIDRAVAILEKLVAEFPLRPQYQFDLSEAYAMQDRGPDAADRLEKAAEIMRKLVDQWPHVPSYRFLLAHVHFRLSHAHLRDAKPEAALTELRRAIDLQNALTERFPAVPTYAMAAASYESAMGRLYEEQSRHEQARALLESAAGRMDLLAAAVGYKPHVRWMAIRCYDQLAHVYDSLGETRLSRDTRRKAVAFRMPPSPSGPWALPSTRPFGVRGPG